LAAHAAHRSAAAVPGRVPTAGGSADRTAGTTRGSTSTRAARGALTGETTRAGGDESTRTTFRGRPGPPAAPSRTLSRHTASAWGSRHPRRPGARSGRWRATGRQRAHEDSRYDDRARPSVVHLDNVSRFSRALSVAASGSTRCLRRVCLLTTAAVSAIRVNQRTGSRSRYCRIGVSIQVIFRVPGSGTVNTRV
jgi:hypothetical protein